MFYGCQTFRLYKRGEAGICCDVDGLSLGPVKLVERAEKSYFVRTEGDIIKTLKAAYGPLSEAAAETLVQKIVGIARSLNRDEMFHAQLKTLYLRLPEIAPENFAKMGRVAMAKAEPEPERKVEMTAAEKAAAEVAGEKMAEALSEVLEMSLAKSDTVVVEKYNHNHDERGRFSSGPGGGSAGGANGDKRPVQVASNDVNRMTDAAPEGAGSNSDPKKDPPWKNKPDANLREYIGSQEVSSDAGYETKTVDTDKDGNPIPGSNHTALGRYQMRNSTLQDAGWKDEKGNWTKKAKNAGVSTDDDFLAKPEAQESAMTDVLGHYSKQLKSNGADKYVGQTIKDSKGEDLPIVSDGLLAAAHREGAPTVGRYLDSEKRKGLSSEKINAIETRLRLKRRKAKIKRRKRK